ncbi:MAG: hypothetical protein M0000_13805 [Actinomycetota bacterium]|nr:hypothetical protein [Actinomycetota bacterium]
MIVEIPKTIVSARHMAYFTPRRRERFAERAPEYWFGLFRDMMTTVKEAYAGLIPGVKLAAPRGSVEDPVYGYREFALCHRSSAVVERGVIRTSEEIVRIVLTPVEGSVPEIEIRANLEEPVDFLVWGTVVIRAAMRFPWLVVSSEMDWERWRYGVSGPPEPGPRVLAAAIFSDVPFQSPPWLQSG